MTRARLTTLGIVALAVVGCGHADRPESRPIAPDPPLATERAQPAAPSLDERFHAAVRDAERADPDEVATDLIALTEPNARLRFRDGPRGREVLVATWTRRQYYAQSLGQPKVIDHGPVWVTTVPELRDFCAATGLRGEALALRMRQYLGLRPTGDHDAIVMMWVEVASLFRPCADPETSDATCGTGEPSDVRFGDAPFRAWFEEMLGRSYGDDGYPWTRLGYTYDWGAERGERGATELVIPVGATVFVQSIDDTNAYCAE